MRTVVKKALEHLICKDRVEFNKQVDSVSTYIEDVMSGEKTLDGPLYLDTSLKFRLKIILSLMDDLRDAENALTIRHRMDRRGKLTEWEEGGEE